MADDIIYAGTHGGCGQCGRNGLELSYEGHRSFCRSPYRNEPKRPKDWRAAQKRIEASLLASQIQKLLAEADLIDKES